MPINVRYYCVCSKYPGSPSARIIGGRGHGVVVAVVIVVVVVANAVVVAGGPVQ